MTPWKVDREVPELRKEYFENEFHDYNHEDGYEDRTTKVFKDTLLEGLVEEFENKDELLDVGCASGYLSKLFKEHFDSVWGIDYCEVRINYAKKLESDGLAFRLVDITNREELEGLGKQFSSLYSSAVIPHIPLEDKAKVFDNLASVSKPGATFVLYDAYFQSPENVNDAFIGIYNDKWLEQNVSSWKVVKCVPIGAAFKYVLKKS
jgi:2-polyprenyl-3-methyl-5-hydroxy-6-metoxy-1,4-benzoquinol methylase